MGCYNGFNLELFTGFWYEQFGFYNGLNMDSIQDSTWVAIMNSIGNYLQDFVMSNSDCTTDEIRIRYRIPHGLL